MTNRFIIKKNNYLNKDICGYYHQIYTGFRQPDNPDFLNTLKNTFNTESRSHLIDARNKVINILLEDIPGIIEDNFMINSVLVSVPRSKKIGTYYYYQLMLKEAIRIAANSIHGVVDGTDCIVRVVDTLTTHLCYATNIPNSGDEPYPGITVATCEIDKNKIAGKNIILIDDIYTKTVNIDEDCIQALLDNGANKIILYSIGYTRR